MSDVVVLVTVSWVLSQVSYVERKSLILLVFGIFVLCGTLNLNSVNQSWLST